MKNLTTAIFRTLLALIALSLVACGKTYVIYGDGQGYMGQKPNIDEKTPVPTPAPAGNLGSGNDSGSRNDTITTPTPTPTPAPSQGGSNNGGTCTISSETVPPAPEKPGTLNCECLCRNKVCTAFGGGVYVYGGTCN